MGNSVARSVNADPLVALRWNASKFNKEELRKLFGDAVDEVKFDVSGGDESENTEGVFGAGPIQNYAESTYASAKEKLIRGIAEDVFTALKMQGASKARTAKIDDLVAHLKKVIPNPKSKQPFYKNFDSAKQREVCDAIANALNNQYGSKLIDPSAEPAAKCRQVAEVMNTLMLGMHTEFMSVASDVVTVLKNLQILREYINASYKKQVEIVEQTGDPGLKDQSAATKELFDRVLQELDRQLAIVGNIMNVSVNPAGKELIGLLKENKDFTGMVADLEADLGSNDFGRKIAYLLSGVSSVAHAANVVQRELKRIGMSVREFKDVKDTAELRRKLFDRILKKSPDSHELEQLMNSYNLIMNTNANHDQVAAAMKGGDEHDRDDNVDSDGVAGGNDSQNLPIYWRKKSLAHKIEKKKEFFELMLREFRDQLMAQYKRLAYSGQQIAQNIGKTIPANDELETFIRHIKQLPSMSRDNMHKVLSGYSKDLVDRTERELFISQYRAVEQSLAQLIKGPGGSHFRDMQQSINGLLKLIDDFGDNMVETLTKITPDRPEDVKEAVRRELREFSGSADGKVDLSINSFVAFDQVIRDMTYYYNIANIRSNLAKTSAELKTYGDDYENILGEEAGWLINQIKREYNVEIDALSDGNVADRKDTERSRAINRIADKNTRKYVVEATRYMLERQRDAKVKMVEVAQAVDLYLKAFANGMASNPDSIESIVKMLDQVELVANWFNERSGDNLARLFEAFPSGLQGANSTSNPADDPIDGATGNVKDVIEIVDGGKHYYEWLSGDGVVANRKPGIPQLGRQLYKDRVVEADKIGNGKKEVAALLKMSERSINGVRALENILSAFAHVGEKFGNLTPQSHTFMNPGQIRNAVADYIACSAFSNQFAPGDNVANAVSITSMPVTQVTPQGGVAAVTIPEVNPGRHRTVSVSGIALAVNRLKNGDVFNNNVAEKAVGNLSGVHELADHNDDATQVRKNTSVAMSSIPPVGFSVDKWTYHNPMNRAVAGDKMENVRVDTSGWRDDFYDTDFLFEMTIKSILAKVFTVIDAYRLFHRPSQDRQHWDSLNPLRSILGGNEVEGGALKKHVRVEDGAFELYLRLPLLAEWYRYMFGLDREEGPDQHPDFDGWRASMVPSIDGIWSDLIHIVFDKANYVNNGAYPESIAQELIEAINKIYRSYNNRGKASARDIINAFVQEMNRVFGFLKQSDIKAYLDNRKSNRARLGDDVAERQHYLGYDVLNAENQFGRSAAPSDKFVNVSTSRSKRDQRVMVHLQKAILDLRRKMDTDMRNASDSDKMGNDENRFSFSTTLNNYTAQLKTARDDESRYKIVLGMLQNSNRMVNINDAKLIMVHESIVAPLLVLQRAVGVARQFNNMIHALNVASVTRWSAQRASAPDTFGADTTISNRMRDAATHWFKKEYSDIPEEQAVEFAHTLVGVMGTFGYLQDAAGNAGAGVNQPLNLQHFDRASVLRVLLGALLDFGQDPSRLAQVTMGNTGVVSVDFSNMMELCDSLLAQIKRNINNMRNEFKNATMLNQYMDQKNKFSTTYLEYQMNLIFRDSRKTGLGVGVGEKLNECLKTLASDNVAVGDELSALLFYRTAARHSDNVGMRNMHTVCDMETFPFNVISTRISQTDMSAEQKQGLSALRSKLPPDINSGQLNAALRAPVIFGVGPADIGTFSCVDTAGNSLMTVFNRVVHNYLRDNIEPGLTKIYLPLFEPFMNGSAASEVVQGQGFPNVGVFHDNVCGGYSPYRTVNRPMEQDIHHEYGLPARNGLLWNSTALAMMSLANDIDPRMKKKRYSYDSLAEVPEFMKERMRCNLPYYSKLLEVIARRASLLRELVENLAVCATDHVSPSATGIRTAFQNAAPQQAALLDTRTLQDRSTAREYFMGQAHHLAALSLDLKKCVDRVYKELQDNSQLFMQVGRDSINDFKARNNMLPLMPASNVILPQKAMATRFPDALTGANQYLLPTDKNGSDQYKFNYASRLLLARSDVEPTMDHMPGAKDLYNDYAKSAGHHAVSIQDYSKTILDMVRVSRFLNDGTYTRLFATEGRQFALITDNKSVYRVRVLPAGVNTVNLLAEQKLLSVLGVRRINRALGVGGPGPFIATFYQAADMQIATAIGDRMRSYALQSASPFVGMIDPLQELLEFGTAEPGDHMDWANRTLGVAAAAPLALVPMIQLLQQWQIDGTADNANVLARLKTLAPRVFQNAMPQSSTVVSIVEDPGVKSNKQRFAAVVNSDNVANRDVDRRMMRTFNILDMNIVPLNVHAFMREVPFVNILNYSYTFDRMVHDFVLPDYVSNKSQRGRAATTLTEKTLMIEPTDAVFTTRGLMVKLLTHPMTMLNRNEYYGVLGSLFNGNDNLKLGRPRYLSDQLWHKVLLTSSAELVGDRIPQPEAGISAYEAQRQMIQHSDFRRFMVADEKYEDPAGGAARPVQLTDDQKAAAVAYWHGIDDRVVARAEPWTFFEMRDAYTEVDAGGAAFVRVALGAALRQSAAMDIVNGAEYLWNGINASGWVGFQSPVVQNAFGKLRDDVVRAQKVQHACQEIIVPLVIQAIVTEANRSAHRAITHAVPAAPPPKFARYINAVPNNAVHNTDVRVRAAIDGLAPSTALGQKMKNALREDAATAATAVGRFLAPVWLPGGGVYDINVVGNDTGGVVAGTLAVAPSIEERDTHSLNAIRVALGVLVQENLLSEQVMYSILYAVAFAISGGRLEHLVTKMCEDPAAPWNIICSVDTIMYIVTEAAGRRDNTEVGTAAAIIAKYLPALHVMNADKLRMALHADGARVVPIKAYNFVLSGDRPVHTAGLKWMRDKKWQVSPHPHPIGDMLYMGEVGYNRFNTKLVRNLTWLVQLQRVMRVMMVGYMTQVNGPIVNGPKIADPSVTEYNGDESWDMDKYQDAGESLI